MRATDDELMRELRALAAARPAPQPQAGLVWTAAVADRQLLRADGVKELRAEYEMETADGTVLTVLNEVIVDDSLHPQRYAISRITVRAPDGPHAWLNRRLFVGTLQTQRPLREAVLVCGCVVGAA